MTNDDPMIKLIGIIVFMILLTAAIILISRAKRAQTAEDSKKDVAQIRANSGPLCKMCDKSTQQPATRKMPVVRQTLGYRWVGYERYALAELCDKHYRAIRHALQATLFSQQAANSRELSSIEGGGLMLLEKAVDQHVRPTDATLEAEGFRRFGKTEDD